MAPSQQSQDALSNNATIQINESQNLVFKLYAAFLTNNTVQTGLKQITRISQPLMGKIDNNMGKITTNVNKLVAHENVYIKLANLWLSLNFPFNGTVVSYEDFTKEIGLNHTNEFAVKNFYDFASEMWKGLENPSLDDIKNAILAIVAKTVNKTCHFEDESFANAIYNMLRMLIEKRKELVSGESYLNLIKVSLGEEFWMKNQPVIQTACNEYYAFAKRFILIIFPLATNNKDILKLIINLVQDGSIYYGDSTLNFIEKRLNFFLRLLGQEQEEKVEDKDFAEKAQRIFRKICFLSQYPLKKLEGVFRQVQATKTFATMDNYLHINEKIDKSVFLTAWGYNILKENILEPSFNKIKVIKSKAKSQVTIVMHDLDIQILKKKYSKLYAKYEILQHCAVSVADQTLKLIFDKQALAKLGEEGKKELLRFYHEVKTMEAEKIKTIGIEYYSTILKKAQKTYHNAQSDYYKKKEITNQETVVEGEVAQTVAVEQN